MFDSWLGRRVTKNVPAQGRKINPSCLSRGLLSCDRRRIRPMLEPLEERFMLDNKPLSFISMAGQMVGAAAGIVSGAQHYSTPPSSLTGSTLTAYQYQQLANIYGNGMNLTSAILGTAGVQGSTGQALKVAGDGTQLASAFAHGAYVDSYLAAHPNLEKTNKPLYDALLDERDDDDFNITSFGIALGGDITGLFNGQVPKLIGDSLGSLHDGLSLLNDLDKAKIDPIAVTGDVASLIGDFAGLISDALGGDTGTQPLQVTMVFPQPDPQAVPVSGANFLGVVAMFADPNSLKALPPGDYSALINWGDGSSSVGQVVSDSSQGWYDVFGSHTYASPSSYPVTVLVTGDGTQGQAEQDAAIQPSIVQSPAQAVNPGADVVLGQAFNGPLVLFLSGDDSSQILQGSTAVINWGDGATSLGQFDYTQGSDQVTVTGSHTYTQPGNYSVGVQISGPDGSSTSGTTAISVNPQGLAVTGQDSGIAGLTFTGTLATFSDPDGDTNPNDYSANITWGDDTQPDGGQSVGQIVSNGNGTFSVLGFYTYSHPGQYNPTVVVADNSDGWGNTAQPSLRAGANLTAVPITAAAGQAFTGPVATFTWADPNAQASDFQAAVHWGDGSGTVGLSSGGDPNVQIVGNGDGIFSILGSHTYFGDGSYNVVVQLFPPGYGSFPRAALDLTSMATVGAAGLMVTGQNLIISPNPSENYSTAKSRTDSVPSGGSVHGTVATFTAPADAGPGNYTAAINWGDGNTSTGQIVANPNGTFNVIGSHTYSQREGYLTSVQVNDTNGNIASAFGKVSPPPPTSSVNPLPATVSSPSFTLSWSGSDPYGPGIASYTIYVSDNGGAFMPWLTNTTQTSATFTGQAGHSYGFYSAATDRLGITQPAPTAAQATISVQSLGNNNPGGNNPGNNHPGPQQKPATPEVPSLLAFINQFLAEVETMNTNSTTITDSLFGIPLVVESYDFFGRLASVSLFGINIPPTWFPYLGL